MTKSWICCISKNKYRIKREDEAALLESQKLELEKQRQLAELERLDATEAQKADIISYYAGKIKDAKVPKRWMNFLHQIFLEQNLCMFQLFQLKK